MKSRGIGDLNDFLEAPSWGDNFRCARSFGLGYRTGQNLCPVVVYL